MSLNQMVVSGLCTVGHKEDCNVTIISTIMIIFEELWKSL